MNSWLKKLAQFRLSIRVTVVTVFIVATLMTAILAVSLQYYFTKKMATSAAVSQFNGLVENTSQYLDSLDDRAGQIAKILAAYPELLNNNWVNQGARDLFSEIMLNNQMFYAIYIGFENGDFYEVVNLNSSPAVRKQLQALANDRWVTIEIRGKGEQRKRIYHYYDQQFHIRTQRIEKSDYDATQRPWFVQAEQNKVNKTPPYLFHNLQAPGQTYSTLVKGTHAVIAVDIALSSLSDFLHQQSVSHDGDVFIYQQTGELIASNRQQLELAPLPTVLPLELTEDERAYVQQSHVLSVSNETDWAPIDFAVSGEPYGYSIDVLSLISKMTGLKFTYVNGFGWNKLVTLFDEGDIDILQPIFKNDKNLEKGLFSEPILQLPFTIVTQPQEKHYQHIEQLKGLRVAIPKGWSIIEVIHQHFPSIKVQEVQSTRAVLEAVQNGQVDAGLDTGVILQYSAKQFHVTGLMFHPDIGFDPVDFPDELHLMVHSGETLLLSILNKAIKQLRKSQQHTLLIRWFDEKTVRYESGTIPYPELIDIAKQESSMNRLQRLKIHQISYFVYVAPISRNTTHTDYFAIVVPVNIVLGATMQKVMLSITITVGVLLILTPIPWLFSSPIVHPIRALAKENEKITSHQYAQVRKPDSRIKEIDDLGQSMLDMSISIEAYIARQKALMDSFIELIAGAIDDKSPYTAGHCRRVPELAVMLAQKAEHSSSLPFSSFAFANEEARREFKIAAWLHDCGKITMPEFIVDKGAKLEVIYNRIHEIRTRFEVLLREAEIDYWQALSQPGADEAGLRENLTRQQEKIKADFEFVANMNVGGEFLSDEKKSRLKDIAQQTWTRYLSDRIGLSPQEELRLADDEPVLPVEEKVISDRPEHLIEREGQTEYDAHLGIKMTVPEYLYNQGELYNLLIERGTLTKEDRFKINEHIIATIKMLDKLPFPPELANVPRYASTHHETMDGKGYPRQLFAKDLSIPERIMVLADVFEALTAADRPYKKAKPISEAIAILYKMVQDHHIDADVFELFLQSGTYLDYAKQFLAPEQIDGVDISQYLK